MREEEEKVYQPDPSLEKAVNDYLANISDRELDEAFAEHNSIEEDDDWDVTLNDGLENDEWNDELETQFWNEQPPKPFATPEELERDGEFDDYGKRVEKVEKKKKKNAKRK
jgi:hypothetical protein